MKQTDLVKHIEKKYRVEDIKYKNLSLWLAIRFRYFSALINGSETGLKLSKTLYKTVIKSVFYGFFNWFRKYDTWFFSAKINRLEIDGKYYDRFFDYPASKVGKPLFIELAIDQHFPRGKVASKYIVSRAPLILLEKLVAIFVNVKKIDLSVISELNEDFGTEYNPNYAIKKMISQYKVMSFLLLFKRPKVVFIAPSYTMFGYVKAFKNKKIKVVEVQHGVITKTHFGYNVYAHFDPTFFPDQILTFGEKEKSVFSGENVFTQSNQVIAIGSFYLSYIQQHFELSSAYKAIRSKYKICFAVSLQDVPAGEKLISFLIEAAAQNPNMAFILKPRRQSKIDIENSYDFPSNIMVIDDINVYELILSTHGHITVYSTCAIEAPALGKQNILINIDNKSKEIFGELLKNVKTTIFVNTQSEFQNCINQFKELPSSEIKAAHKNIITTNYKLNVDAFLAKIYG